MKTFLFLWLQLSPNSNLPSYMVNKPRAISITEMQEEKIQPRHTGKKIKTSERYLEQGAHRKEVITLGQSITAGRGGLTLGIKGVSNLDLHIPAQMGEQHSH